jgi:hypothetical protein
MKINSKTRIRLKRSIGDALGVGRFNSDRVATILSHEYDMCLTSRRWYVLFFQPRNPQKLALFLLKYSEYVEPKTK